MSAKRYRLQAWVNGRRVERRYADMESARAFARGIVDANPEMGPRDHIGICDTGGAA